MMPEFELLLLKPKKFGSTLPMEPGRLRLGKLKGKRFDKGPAEAAPSGATAPGVGSVAAYAEPRSGLLDALVLASKALLGMLGTALMFERVIAFVSLTELGLSSFTRLAPSKRLAQ